MIPYLETSDIDELKAFLPKVHDNTKKKQQANGLPSIIHELKTQLVSKLPVNTYRKFTKNDDYSNFNNFFFFK